MILTSEVKPCAIKIVLFAVILNIPVIHSQTTGSVTQGPAVTTIANMMPDCPSNHVTPLGTITSADGNVWIVPAENNFATAPGLADLYNTCNGITPANLQAASLANIPVTEIDPDGEIITGYLFADNYFELYINGVLTGVDAVPFTPFNSAVVKFRVSRPYTIAVKLVDWEENPGLGSEINNGNNYHPGDGGFIAQFSDGTVTDETWKTQVFYIAPIQDLNTVMELSDGTRSTAAASLTPTCNSNCYGVHYPTPVDWMNENFNETGWVSASLYTAAQVTNQAAFKNFETTAWPDARFIWTSNLILDNLVLARKTVGNPASGTGSANIGNDYLKVVPNPAQGSILLRTGFPSDTDQPVEIRDTGGRVVYKSMLPAGASEQQLPVAEIVPGLYWVCLQNHTIPVVIQ